MLKFILIKVQCLLKLKVVKYGVIGCGATFIHISIASLCIFFIEHSIFQSNIIGFLVAYLFSYVMQSTFVFESNISVKSATKYFLVQFCVLILVIYLSKNLYQYSTYIQTLIVAMLLPGITFFIHEFWTFNSKKKQS